MAKKIVYIIVEISPTRLKVVAFDSTNNTLLTSTVKDLTSIKEGRDRDGFIVKTIKDLLQAKEVASNVRKFGSLTPKKVMGILCLSDDSAQVKRTELPYMPLDDIREALRWRVKGMLPFDVEKAVLDFDVIGEFTDDDGGRKYNLILAAIEKEEVDKRLSLLKEAGLNVIGGVNVGSFGLSNIIKLKPEGKGDGTCAVLNVGYAKSIVNIYRRSRLVFARSIPVGINNIKDAVKSSIIAEIEPMQLTDEDVKELKNAGLPENKEKLLGGRLEGRHLLAYLRPVLESLCNEVRRSLDYYSDQLEGSKASKLYLVGDGLPYRNLNIFISDSLKIDTEYLDFPSPVKEDMPQIVPLIGAALGGPEAKVNLFPKEYRIEKVQKIQKVSIRMVGFTIFAILAASFIFAKARVSDYEKRLVNVKSHMKILQEVKVLYEDILQRKDLIRHIGSGRISIVSILKELSNAVPDNVVFNRLIVDHKMDSVEIEGVVYLGSEIAEVVLRDLTKAMEESPFFKDVSLASSRKSSVEDKKVVLFTVVCNIQI
jgi:type IV pilus assembly protein PilM